MKSVFGISLFGKILAPVFCAAAASGIGSIFFCVNEPKLSMLVNIEMYLDPPEREHRTDRQFFVNENIDVYIEVAFKEPIDTLAFGAIVDTGEDISKEDMRAVCDSIRTGAAIGLENRFPIRFDRPGKVLLVGVAWSEDDYDLDTLHIQIVANDTFYTVTYDGHDATGGDVPVDTAHYRQGATVKVSGNSGNLVNDGKTFVGWMIDTAQGSIRYSPGSTYTMNASAITFYAAWTDSVTYRVLYIGNGSTSGRVPHDNNAYLPGMAVQVAAQGDLAREGYDFAGWNTDPGGNGMQYNPDESFTMKNDTVTLYAQWTDKSRYTVTYNGNGTSSGKPPVDNKSYSSGDAVILKDNTGNLERPGFDFIGWGKREETNDTMYAPGMALTMDSAAITLYAQWTDEQTWTVTYVGNDNTGGDIPIRPHRYLEGATVHVLGNTGKLVKTGYTFKKWNTSKDSNSGSPYDSGATFEMGTSDVVLYAIWEVNTYKVTYDGNGHTDGQEPPPTNHQFGSKVIVAEMDDLKRTGYTFYSWNTKSDGNGTDYMAGKGEFTIGAADLTLFARWIANRYPVIYYGNGNTGGEPPGTVSYLYDTSVTIQKHGSLTKSCSSFVAWNTVVNGSGTAFREDTVIKMTPDTLKLYAQWVVIPYTITFDKNDAGATGTMAPQTIACGATLNLTLNAYVKTGWSFAGWANSSDGAVVYADKASYQTRTGNAILYARWNPPAGMVKIAAKGATFSMGDANATPVHQVTFTKDFWMDTTEVTQGQYSALMAATYSGYTSPAWSSTYGVGNNHPAYYVSWFDAVLYCNARTKASGSTDTVYRYTGITGTPGNSCSGLAGLEIDLSKTGFRLPSEAQWEYACRGGTTTDFYWGKNYNPYPSTVADSNEVDIYSVWRRNSSNKGSGNTDYGTHPVATKLKNPVGLYDMSGNVWEWCNDWYGSYGSEAQTDPIGPATGSGRVHRGGGWNGNAIFLRSADRGSSRPGNANDYGLGFRTCLPAP